MFINHILLVLLSLVSTFFIIFSFNRLPDSWLRDYEESCCGDFSASVPRPSASSLSYFLLIFLSTLLSMSLLSYNESFWRELPIYVALLILLIHISISDALYMIIPDQHLLGILILGCVDLSCKSLSYQLLGLLTGALPYLIVFLLSLMISGKEGIGFGDVKLMAALGFLFGPHLILQVYVVSSLLSGIFSLFRIFLHFFPHANQSLCIPLGPFICFSCVFCMIIT